MFHSIRHYSEPTFPPHARRKLMVMVGVPASGKTSWVEEFLTRHAFENWVVVSGDAIRKTYAQDHGLSYQQSHASPHAERIRTLFDQHLYSAVQSGANLIVDTLSDSPQKRDALFDQLTRCVALAQTHDAPGRRYYLGGVPLDLGMPKQACCLQDYYDARIAVVHLIGEEQAVKRNRVRNWRMEDQPAYGQKIIPESIVRESFRQLQRDVPRHGGAGWFTGYHYRMSHPYQHMRPGTVAWIRSAERQHEARVHYGR